MKYHIKPLSVTKKIMKKYTTIYNNMSKHTVWRSMPYPIVEKKAMKLALSMALGVKKTEESLLKWIKIMKNLGREDLEQKTSSDILWGLPIVEPGKGESHRKRSQRKVGFSFCFLFFYKIYVTKVPTNKIVNNN